MSEPSPQAYAAWLAFLGTPDCPCPSEWRRDIGHLYGMSMGGGWVRMSTDPKCRHHAKPEEPT